MKYLNEKSILTNLLAVVAALFISTTAHADHKTNVPTFDIAVVGANFPGYTSIARCQSYNPGKTCVKLVNDCGPGNADVYTTQFFLNEMLNAINNGQTLPVHTMSSTGHFLKKICTLQ